MSTVGSYVPYIPGITGVYGSTSAMAGYAILTKNSAKEISLVQNASVVKANTAYFENAVKGMKTVNDLLNDPRALDYVLTAYGLDSDSSEMGIIKQVLTQDPTQQTSLVNQLADPRWKTMATDLNLFANGLSKLQGNTTTQTYDPVTFSNEYLQAQSQDALGNDQGDYYSNSMNLTVNATTGNLQTSQGYNVMGLKLDNQGNIEQPYSQLVVNQTNTVSVPVASADGGGQVNVTQAFSNNGNGTWDWKVTDSSGNVLSDQTVNMAFNADGSLASINGLSTLDANGNPTNTTQSTTLNWADGTSTTQTFDFAQAFQNATIADQTNAVSIPASAADGGGQVGVTQAFTNNGNGTWDWKVTDSSGNTLSDQTVNLSFTNGALASINGVPALDSNGNPTTTTLSTTLTWPDGSTSTQSFDFAPAFQAATDSVAGYQASDLRAVKVNWFDGGSTPTTTLTPNVVLNSAQTVDSNTTFTNVQSIPSDQTDGSGNTIQAAVTQTLTKQSDGSYDWKITNSDGTVLSDQNLALTFNGDGSLATVNGSANTSLSPTLTWADSGTTTQSFDLSTLVDTADFSENVNAIDNTGASRALTLNYTKISNSQNLWQVNVVDQLTGKTATSTDVLFNSNGQVQSVGQYNPSTGTITGTNGSPVATSTSFNINWGGGFGTSNLTLDFSNVQSNNGISQELQPIQTDSVKLGARQTVDIAQDGTVSATYAKADGSGNVTIPLYRLAVNNFQNAGALSSSGSSGYFTANTATGTDTVQPLGVDKDSFGNILPGEAGNLTKNPTTTTTTNLVTSIEGKYDNSVFQEAVGQDNPAIRYALYFQQNAPTITNVDQLLGDAVLTDFVETAFNIPQGIANQALSTQEQIFTSSINVKQLSNTQYVNQLINQFLAVSDANGDPGSSSSTDPSVTLVTNGVAGTSGTDLASSLTSFIGQNINTLA